MILPPGVPGVAFGTARDGDARSDQRSRRSISSALGISDAWALIDQVHGSTVLAVKAPGHHGEADGLFTVEEGLPLAVATADCVPVAILGDGATAVVHAGWRGVAAGVVTQALSQFAEHKVRPTSAVLGPHIGSCCYEVGDEVVEAIGGYSATTSWGTTSVSLADAIVHQLEGISTLSVGGCTMEDAALASHRENATPLRQVTVVWNP